VGAFAEAGWDVVSVGRRRASAAPGAVALRGDVTDPLTSRRAVAAALEHFGRLDAAVASAGVTLAKSVDDTSEAELHHLIAVNVSALVYLAQAAHGALAQTRGSYTVIASNKGLVGQRGSPVYVATKGAAVQLARALALDWAPEGIRVNALCPGLVDTPMLRSFADAQPDPAEAKRRLGVEQPLGRLARTEECAEAVLFLSSPAASFISGVALPLDGGFTAQ
jgi:NAD(P)-dependent dehydrogenase (short-subunit alcohol dehydrogenase family)